MILIKDLYCCVIYEMFFHIICFSSTLLFWCVLLAENVNKPFCENKNAIVNNLQLIFCALFVYIFDDILTTTSILDDKTINLLGSISCYISLSYNIVDSFIKIYQKKIVFLIHHLAIMPLILAYLLLGKYKSLYFIYGFLEVSSLSYNFRQIYPCWDLPHKFIYICIRTISTPLLLYFFITESLMNFFEINIYILISCTLSNIVICIFNIASIKMTINSLFKKPKLN